jgi:hypothetical protein
LNAVDFCGRCATGAPAEALRVEAVVDGCSFPGRLGAPVRGSAVGVALVLGSCALVALAGRGCGLSVRTRSSIWGSDAAATALPARLRACGDRQIVVLTARRAIVNTVATSRLAWLVVI